MGYVSVAVLGDTVPEPSETLGVQLSLPKHLVIIDATATGTIVDPDVTALTVNDVYVNEDDATATFTVRLSHVSASRVTFTYGTIDGTATAADDYDSTSNRTSIEAGATSTTIAVPIKEDLLDEAGEHFSLVLSNVINATATDREGFGFIEDNDAAPTMAINDAAAVAEGSNTTFTVSLSEVSGRDVTVRWATSDDSAFAPVDYAAGNGTLTIPAGQQAGSITVTTVDDSAPEGEERFAVDLSPTHTATLADGHGWGTIPANDQPT